MLEKASLLQYRAREEVSVIGTELNKIGGRQGPRRGVDGALGGALETPGRFCVCVKWKLSGEGIKEDQINNLFMEVVVLRKHST